MREAEQREARTQQEATQLRAELGEERAAAAAAREEARAQREAEAAAQAELRSAQEGWSSGVDQGARPAEHGAPPASPGRLWKARAAQKVRGAPRRPARWRKARLELEGLRRRQLMESEESEHKEEELAGRQQAHLRPSR